MKALNWIATRPALSLFALIALFFLFGAADYKMHGVEGAIIMGSAVIASAILVGLTNQRRTNAKTTEQTEDTKP